MRTTRSARISTALLILGATTACNDNTTPPGPGGTPIGVPGGGLLVTPASHVVAMEYEAWFGPNAVTFQGTAAKPLLQSADMQPAGGGYDSADPNVIAQHVTWLETMGVDAAVVDLTNNVACTFNSTWFVTKYLQNFNGCPTLRADYQTIRDNTGNLYPAWSKLGTPLTLIPLVGAIDQNAFIADSDGTTAFEKEIAYFGALMRQYPARRVIYENKPLILVYLGAAQDPNPADQPLWTQALQLIHSRPALDTAYTFRLMAGYLDSQPGLWATSGTPSGPIPINPAYGFWSWVDRLNPSCTIALCPYYPTYNQAGARIENLTVSIATAGQNGWGCPNPNSPPYCPDAALRYGPDSTYDTFAAFMAYARALDPIFLIVHQFNEFTPPDEGFDANTDDDIEPANLWGTSAMHAVQSGVAAYRDPP